MMWEWIGYILKWFKSAGDLAGLFMFKMSQKQSWKFETSSNNVLYKIIPVKTHEAGEKAVIYTQKILVMQTKWKITDLKMMPKANQG